jgi:hypothetical protein
MNHARFMICPELYVVQETLSFEIFIEWDVSHACAKAACAKASAEASRSGGGRISIFGFRIFRIVTRFRLW